MANTRAQTEYRRKLLDPRWPPVGIDLNPILVDDAVLSALPHRGQPSIYFVFSGKEIIYIGITGMPKCRLQKHKRSERFIGCGFYVQEHDDMRAVQRAEKILIHALKPALNVKTYRPEYF